MKNQTPLAVMRIQPIHLGHKLLIEEMLKVSDTPIICIGSTQESKTEKNPYSYEERKKMLKAVFQNNDLIILPLIDLGAVTTKEWTDYVLGEILKVTELEPTIYFAGSQIDLDWWRDRLPTKIIDRETLGKKISATEVRKRIKNNQSIFDIIPIEIREMI